MELEAQIYAEPERVILGIVDETAEPAPILTLDDGTKCRVITVGKGDETMQVCVPLGSEE